MPQAKHGGNGVFAVAAEGSNVEGTGLEYEQIAQTHVAVLGLGTLNGNPLVGKAVLT